MDDLKNYVGLAGVTDESRWPASESWFCLRTQPKHEQIAAAQLRQEAELEVFAPRIRFKRTTRNGTVWVTEALFQNYIFARFNLLFSLRRVQAARGVSGVLHFGLHWPAIPDETIRELQALMENRDLRVIEDTLQPGDAVQIAGGAMHGLQAVVTRVMPAQMRVAVLLDFVGRQTTVELDRSQLIIAAVERSQRTFIAASDEAERATAALF